MDLRLPLLADCNLHLNIAEEALSEASYTTARNELEKAEDALAELREIWPEIDQAQQGLLAALAKPLSARYKEMVAQLPKVSVLSDGVPETDPEEDEAPPEE